MLLRHRAPHDLERFLDHGVGKGRELVRKTLHREAPVDVGDEKTEDGRVIGVAQKVHLPLLIVSALGERLAEALAPFAPVDRREVVHFPNPSVDEFVEDDRVRGDEIRAPAARREHAAHAFGRPRVLAQKRHVGGSSRHGFEKPQITREEFRRGHDAHGVALHPLRNVCDHHLQELLHLLERSFGLEGRKAPHREVRRPLRELRRVLGRIALADEHFFERGSCARSPGLPAHGPIALRPFGRVLHLKDVLEGPAHAVAHGFVVRPEFFGRDAEKRRCVHEIFPFAREKLRLLIVHVLQRMFDVSQPHIVFLEFFGDLGREHAFFAEPRQHRERFLAAKPHVAAAADHLQRLREEFDFPNAAAPELHVRAREVSLRLAARRFGAERLVELRERTDRAEVEVLAEYEGANEILDRVRSALELLGA